MRSFRAGEMFKCDGEYLVMAQERRAACGRAIREGSSKAGS